jgi:hypothetical protein
MPIHDVFLSHNSKDKYYVTQIAEHLERSNLTVWFDKDRIFGGDNFQDEIQEAIISSATAVICIGSHELGRWQKVELDALRILAGDQRIKIVTLLLPMVEELPDQREYVFLKSNRYLQWKNGDSEGLDELVDSIFQSFRSWRTLELKRLEEQRRDIEARLREVDQKINQIKSDFGTELSDQDIAALKWLSLIQKNIKQYAVKAINQFPSISNDITEGAPIFEKFCIDLDTLIDFIDSAFRTKHSQRIHDIGIDFSLKAAHLPQDVTAYEVYASVLKLVKNRIPTDLVGKDIKKELEEYFHYLETQVLSLI